MRFRRLLLSIKAWIIYRLDQFVGWSPLIQIPALVLLTAILVLGWSAVARLNGSPPSDLTWWTLSRFMDGGTMAGDTGLDVRVISLGVTVSGVLLISLVIGAVSSKLSERIEVLRQGRGAIAVRGHVLVLGFDAKVPLIARELARSHRRMTMVTLSPEDKSRQEVLLKSAQRIHRGRLKTIARTGDPRHELSLLRVGADRARCIVVIAPSDLDDDAALRWTLSALLAIRRVTAVSFSGQVIVEARRAAQAPLLSLAGEAGLAGDGRLSIEVIASDDVVARVLAQSIRHGAVYLALRELLSFAGSELYLEPISRELIGRSFEEAHAKVQQGIAVGLRRADGSHLLAPPSPGQSPLLAEGDELIVLEEDEGVLRLGGSLPEPPRVDQLKIDASPLPQTVAVLGSNRTLPCLITELDLVMPPGSVLRVSCPHLAEGDHRALEDSVKHTKHVRVERTIRAEGEVGRGDDPSLAEADGVVILGCDDDNDPDGDTSALALLLQLRHARRSGHRPDIRRLITEVRDPVIARQVAGSVDDFLVSTDIVGMAIAHAAYDPRLLAIYRELLDPTGVEIYVRPRQYYLPDGPTTFDRVMIAARRRGDVAIGFFPDTVHSQPVSARLEIELGIEQLEEVSPVRLNPPRDEAVPDGRASIIVLSHWH